MSGLTISSGSLRLPDRGGAAGGTSAEQAVQRAQKAYAQAVERLRTDALHRADEQVVKVDQAAVDLAGTALAQARAALAREQRQAQAASGAASARHDEATSPAQAGPDADALAKPVADSVQLTTRPTTDGDARASGGEQRDRAGDEHREHAARRDRQRLDDALTAVLSVNALA